MRLVGFDTETDLIAPGLKAPPLVCFTLSESGKAPTIHRWDDWATLLRLWTRAANGEIKILGHNVAYDAIVCMAHRKDLIPLIFEAYAKDAVECTMLRASLLRLEKDGLPRAPSLDKLARKYLDRALDKDEDGWRLRFGELKHLPLADWPQRAVDYALSDADILIPIYDCQDMAALHNDTFADSCNQARYHLAFTLMAAWGLKTDTAHVERVRAQLEALQVDRADYLVRAGVMRPTKEQRLILEREGITDLPKGKPGSIATKILQRKLLDEGADLPETPASLKKEDQPPEDRVYSLAGEVLETLESDLADTYLHFRSDGKQLSTYLDKYAAGLVQCSVNPLLANGRKALSKPSLQNLPTSGPVRESFVARPGTVLCSTDYAGIELRTHAQANLWLVGYSRMAELFKRDPDADLHSLVASRILGISEEEGLRRKAAKDPDFKNVRDKQAKRAVFGLGGGMGLDRFDLTLRKEGVHLPREQLAVIKEAYLDAFPEMRDYFRMCSDMLPQRTHPEHKPKTGMQCLISRRYRGGVGYCQIANGWFSSLMTDGANDAAWRVCRNMYDPSQQSLLFGARIVNAVHDEIIAEVDQHGAHEQGFEIARIMCETMMERYTPDIPITAEPALMERWYKNAQTVYDDKGRLQVWRPGV